MFRSLAALAVDARLATTWRLRKARLSHMAHDEVAGYQSTGDSVANFSRWSEENVERCVDVVSICAASKSASWEAMTFMQAVLTQQPVFLRPSKKLRLRA
jgi:hypothetical protein